MRPFGPGVSKWIDYWSLDGSSYEERPLHMRFVIRISDTTCSKAKRGEEERTTPLLRVTFPVLAMELRDPKSRMISTNF